jgi:hypothetical protein
MYANNLTGTLPSQLAELTSLTELYVIWSELRRFECLCVRSLFTNGFVGAIFTQIGRMTKLQTL